MQFWLTQLLNGLSFAALLFLLASGLTLIFGLMRVVNISHGSYYLLGAYVALTVV
ncbi:MAG: branched-chain amino acid ABC transporter permease, partial [Armatimonadota bacterium]|nr:branched-chain amino acid ABC transporter permease [Armatimonadota bacterium]MDW8155442.1 branched-chain amino acid ABC transporter permease [Armatimonadota bacterium]